jgi:polar amino acid transport system substrate-binding protein
VHRRYKSVRLLIGLLLALLTAGCNVPREQEGTLQRVRGSILRAGISDIPRWTYAGDGAPTAIDVRLLREMARDLKARMGWVQGSEYELLEPLKRFQLEVVIAA